MDSQRSSPDNAAMQQTHSIYLAFSQYAQDHNGKYPSGHSSTEIFQKLVDGKYFEKYTAEDGWVGGQEGLDLFYVPLPGKTKAPSNILKPENICWDVTICDGPMPDKTPLIFLTGYKISYAPDSSAVPLFTSLWGRLDGIAVAYSDGNSRFVKNDPSHGGNIPHFVPANFDPGTKKFQQLTPTGPLP
jgi:hypothetical protein